MDSTLIGYILGPAGAAGLTLLLILLGVLVPKPYHERILQQNAKLQAANDTLTAALADEREQNARLASSGQLTNQLVNALIQVAHERGAAIPLPPGPPGEGP